MQPYCAGLCGFCLGATPNAMANMSAVCYKYRYLCQALPHCANHWQYVFRFNQYRHHLHLLEPVVTHRLKMRELRCVLEIKIKLRFILNFA